MKRFITFLLALTLCAGAFAQWQIDPRDYKISKKDLARAMELLAPSAAGKLLFPNPAPGAQWFPSASLGLFLHWGIHSMIGAQPSWNMIKGYEWGGEYHSR